MRFSHGFAVLVILAGVFVSAPSFAQAKGYAGGFVGLSVPDEDNTSGRPMFGIVGGARLDGEWGFGGYYMTSAKKESVSGVDVDFNYDIFGLEGSYHFEGYADNAYAAVRAGISKVKAGNTNFSPMAWGLVLGYDFPLMANFSIGAEAGWMSVSKETKSGATLDAFHMLNYAVAAKFWF